MIGDCTGVWSGIPTDFPLSLPIPLVNVLYQMLPIVEVHRFFYEHECVLDAIRERLLEPVAECAITPVDLTGQCVELDEEVREFLIRPHAKVVEFRLRVGLRVRISEHIAELLDEKRPVMQPVRRHEIGVLFVFELRVEVALGGPT